VARELELKRQAIAKAEAEARFQAELRDEQERMLVEQQQQEEERLARIRAEEEQRRLAAEKAEAGRLAAERIALQQAREEAARLAEEKAETVRIKAAEQEAARLLAEAEQRAREEEKRQLVAHMAAEEARRLEEQRITEQAAAKNARRLEAQRLAAEEAAQLEAERLALAEAEAQALRGEEERVLAERQRLEKEQAEAKARQLAGQRAAEEADRRAAEAMRQAEIAAEEESIRAEQHALEEKLHLAEQEEAASDKKSDKGIFGAMLALVSGDDADKKVTDESTTVIQTDSTGEVILNESTSQSQVEFTNSTATAPREAVVVLQAAERPAEKKLTAPAPVRVSLEDGQSGNTTGENMGDMAAQIASAIVSIRTTNDPQASGFILDSKGHILTGWHVINGVTDIDVSFMAISGAPRAYKAKVVKYDKFHDLALLRLVNPPEGIQPISVAGDELPDAGSTVRVFGQKDGQVWATDSAVITRIAPHFTWFSQDNVIHRGEVLQVDLPVEGKDIGSLVTTMDYKMLGVKSFSGSQTGRTYAVSVRMIRDFVEARGVTASEAKDR